MAVLTAILANWDIIIVAVVIIIGVALKLKSLWTGNMIDWLIAICNEMEEEFGAGMGLIKKTKAYTLFVQQFPILSKFISSEKFDELVDDALNQLEEFLESKKR